MPYRLRNPKPEEIYWPEDCKRIQRVMKDAYDVDIPLTMAQWIWEDHSDGLAASWLFLPEDDGDLACVLGGYVEEVP